MNRQFYSSKLLLFGEYTIIQGSKALAMPLAQFSGQWDFVEATAQSKAGREGLWRLFDYLREQIRTDSLGFPLSIDRFQAHLERDLYFHSTIPVGYGLGSSGALTAAVYDRFYDGEDEKDWVKLQQRLAKIEACFHGASSGIDPLICLLNQTVLIHSKTTMEAVQIPDWNQAKQVVFLLNTQMPRQTAPLVNIFQERCKDDYYKLRCQSELIPSNNNAIHAFLQADWPHLLECIHEIGYFQYRYFDAMIPQQFRPIWLDGLSSDLYKLKLCGAGGGGFILGFTQHWDQTKAALSDYELTPIVFQKTK